MVGSLRKSLICEILEVNKLRMYQSTPIFFNDFETRLQHIRYVFF